MPGSTTELAVLKPQPSSIELNADGVQLHSMEDLFRLATAIHQSGLAPRGVDTPQKILVAIETGLEAGLKPMQALRMLMVVNGRPSWIGDGAKAIVFASGKCLDYATGFDGQGDDYGAWVQSRRAEMKEPTRSRFAVTDAKRANLWGKAGPWTQYPDRMLYYRAWGFHARDLYSDVLAGLAIAEEVADFPPEAFGGRRTIAGQTLPPAVSDPLLAELGLAPNAPPPPAAPPAEPKRMREPGEDDDEPAPPFDASDVLDRGAKP